MTGYVLHFRLFFCFLSFSFSDVMNASTANQILIYMQIAEMEREKEKKRLRSMSPREIKGERRARRRVKARARQFVDDEAKESEGEVEDPEPAEEGFEEGVFFPKVSRFQGRTFRLPSWQATRQDLVK